MHPGSTLALAPCQSPCVLWKGPWTFVRQRILLTPTRERGGFTSPVLSVCWLGRMPQKQNVCFLIARVLEGPFALASTPLCPGRPSAPWGPSAETVSVTVWPGVGRGGTIQRTCWAEGHQGLFLPTAAWGPPFCAGTQAEPGGARHVCPPLSPQAAWSSSHDPAPEPGSGVQGQGCVGLGMAHTGSWMASREDDAKMGFGG